MISLRPFPILRLGVIVSALMVAQSAVVRGQTPSQPRKQITACRITGSTVHLDGRLDDSCWIKSDKAADFTQKEPHEGQTATEPCEVGFAYDDHALYIGARMFSRDPGGLKRYLNRRDNPGSSEQIIISLDTYCDRRTCYDFGVSVAGVRDDRYHPVDNEYERDRSYNAVWEAKTNVDSLGWTAEIKIPFSQLRFNAVDSQVWGVNINRWNPARNEDDFWIVVPKNETGWSSRFGDLVGITAIRPTRRLELLPYLAGDGQFTGNTHPNDPLHDGSDLASRLGGDLKMGIGPNLTLDATINPDFGQVEADPAVVNLTAYETVFEEKRPFFIEGRDRLDADGPTYFYTRRIGGPPHEDDPDGDFVDAPTASTILGAAKLTGRLPSGLSIGTLGAVTSRERARIFDTASDERSRVLIEPTTGYGVLRLQQQFGEDESTIGIILTGTGRDLPNDDPLRSQLHRSAVTGGSDLNLRFNGGAYELTGVLGFSHVRGDAEALALTQESSTHYYQRPDANHVDFDTTRTSLSGYTAALALEKRAGKHWLWEMVGSVESPGFELNDAGVVQSVDDIGASAEIIYRENAPAHLLHRYEFGLNLENAWNYGGVRRATELTGWTSLTWPNFWSVNLALSGKTRARSDDLTRGGPLMATLASLSGEIDINNAMWAATRYGGSFVAGRNEDDGWAYEVSANTARRLGRRLSVAVSTSYERRSESRQYVDTRPGGPDATFGQRYILSHIEQSELKAQFRVDYFFTPDLSLEVYAEPFSASGRYAGFGELKRAGGRALRTYGADGTTITQTDDGDYRVADGADTVDFDNPDFGERSFRSNVVLRWEFRPGSTLYLVWQQNREGEDDVGRLVAPRSLWRTLRADGDNVVAVKISYWLPVS